MEKVSTALLSTMVAGQTPHTLGTSRDCETFVSKQSAKRVSDTTLSMSSGQADMPSFCSMMPDRCNDDVDLDEVVTSLMVCKVKAEHAANLSTRCHYCFLLQTTSFRTNPFSYDSSTPDHKDPSAIHSSTSSPDSSAISIDYFDSDGNRLSVKDTLEPVRRKFDNLLRCDSHNVTSHKVVKAMCNVSEFTPNS